MLDMPKTINNTLNILTESELKERLLEGAEVVFRFNDKNCGIASEVADSIFTFSMWYGDKLQEFSNIDDLLVVEFFDGKTLLGILGMLSISFF